MALRSSGCTRARAPVRAGQATRPAVHLHHSRFAFTAHYRKAALERTRKGKGQEGPAAQPARPARHKHNPPRGDRATVRLRARMNPHGSPLGEDPGHPSGPCGQLLPDAARRVPRPPASVPFLALAHADTCKSNCGNCGTAETNRSGGRRHSADSSQLRKTTADTAATADSSGPIRSPRFAAVRTFGPVHLLASIGARMRREGFPAPAPTRGPALLVGNSRSGRRSFVGVPGVNVTHDRRLDAVDTLPRAAFNG